MKRILTYHLVTTDPESLGGVSVRRHRVVGTRKCVREGAWILGELGNGKMGKWTIQGWNGTEYLEVCDNCRITGSKGVLFCWEHGEYFFEDSDCPKN